VDDKSKRLTHGSSPATRLARPYAQAMSITVGVV
jgi:hypothetical protein